MKIFNVIWLDYDNVEPYVQSFYNFEDAKASVESELKNYPFEVDTFRLEENHLFARINDVIDVEIIGAEIK